MVKDRESKLEVTQTEVSQLQRQIDSDTKYLNECKADLKSCNEMFKTADGVATSCIRERRSLTDTLSMCEIKTKEAFRR